MKNLDENTGEENIGGLQMKFDCCFYLQACQEAGIWGKMTRAEVFLYLLSQRASKIIQRDQGIHR